MTSTIALSGSSTILHAIQSGSLEINGVISGTGELIQSGSQHD